MQTMTSSKTPPIKIGDTVVVTWSNGEDYIGVVRDKLRKNWAVEIQDKQWHYNNVNASVPEFRLIPIRKSSSLELKVQNFLDGTDNDAYLGTTTKENNNANTN